LVDNPIQPLETLATLLSGPGRDVLQLTLAAVDALVARALAEPSERGTIVRVLESLARAQDYVVRRHAIEGLGRFDQPQPEVGQASSLRHPEIYRDIVRRTEAKRTLRMRTNRGELVLEIDCPRTPLTCFHVAQLADQGFYDGLLFHRATAAVLELGDPRGDGWGGPGFRLRDEVTPQRLLKGSLVMARRQPHTAGSRFLLLLQDRPDMEGEYTRFGRVIGGAEVLERIGLGDRVESIREISPGQ